MLARRLRRRPNIGTTLVQHLVFAGDPRPSTEVFSDCVHQCNRRSTPSKRYPIDLFLGQCWFSVAEGGPTLLQY